MKKIILILFLFLSCYLIYILTEKNTLSCLVIGDKIADNIYLRENKKVTSYNNTYINKDYRIIDLINIIKHNEELKTNNKKISIHRLMKKTDILILSVGMNDIYSKLNDNTKDIYTYMNDMINNMETLLTYIDKYNYQEVLILGYYNINKENNDIFTYLNYKMKKITEKKGYTYLELNNIIKNDLKYYEKTDNFNLNDTGYRKINEIIVEKLKKY